MTAFNNKNVKQVVFSPIQKDDATDETKSLIIVFEDDTQTTLNGGVSLLKIQSKNGSNQVEEMQKRIDSINDLIKYISDNLKIK